VLLCTLIVFAMFCFYRRRARNYPRTPPKGPDPRELPDNGLAEVEQSIPMPRYELKEDYVKRAELPSGVEGDFERLKARELKDPALAMYEEESNVEPIELPPHPAVRLKPAPRSEHGSIVEGELRTQYPYSWEPYEHYR
jgi:hypothetical protein